MDRRSFNYIADIDHFPRIIKCSIKNINFIHVTIDETQLYLIALIQFRIIKAELRSLVILMKVVAFKQISPVTRTIHTKLVLPSDKSLLDLQVLIEISGASKTTSRYNVLSTTRKNYRQIDSSEKAKVKWSKKVKIAGDRNKQQDHA